MVGDVDIYCDSGSLDDIKKYAQHPRIAGFTTNPTLAKKSGVSNYRAFASAVIGASRNLPISLEVLSAHHEGMEKEAREIASWGENVYVKIPITDAQGKSSRSLIHDLSDLKLNVTAVMTHAQIEDILPVIKTNHIISVFCGRITDTQRVALDVRYYDDRCKFLWASTRDVGSLRLADKLGYDIITMAPDLIEKLPLEGKNLTQYSLETVRQFVKDGEGITL